MFTIKELPNLSQLVAYIEYRGWTSTESPYKNALTYLSPSDDQGNRAEIVLPSNNLLVDYRRRVLDSLETISVVHEIAIDQLVVAVFNLYSDVVRVAIDDRIISGSSIPLDVASNFIIGLHDLMAYAATTEAIKEKQFIRTAKKGIEFAESCRFGHTFRGSFGFTVTCPLEKKERNFLTNEVETPPFQRKVFERIYNGLNCSLEALEKEDVTILSNNYEVGLSVNMADQIVLLHEIAKNSDIDYSFSWSPEWSVCDDRLIKPHIKVDYHLAEIIKEAAKSMRSKEGDDKVTVRGYVVGLKSKFIPGDEDNDTINREVTVLVNDIDTLPPTLKVKMNKKDYIAAVDAHRNGRMIQLICYLEKVKNKWVVSEYNDFIVLS